MKRREARPNAGGSRGALNPIEWDEQKLSHAGKQNKLQRKQLNATHKIEPIQPLLHLQTERAQRGRVRRAAPQAGTSDTANANEAGSSTDTSRAETETEDDADADVDMDRAGASEASPSPEPRARLHGHGHAHGGAPTAGAARRAVGIVSDDVEAQPDAASLEVDSDALPPILIPSKSMPKFALIVVVSVTVSEPPSVTVISSVAPPQL